MGQVSNDTIRLGPMAFAQWLARDLKVQGVNCKIQDKFRCNLALTPADAKKLESSAPSMPQDLEASILLAKRWAKLLEQTFEDKCSLAIQAKAFAKAFVQNWAQFLHSSMFVAHQLPSSLWTLT